MKIIKLFLTLLLAASLVLACNEKKPVDPNDDENGEKPPPITD